MARGPRDKRRGGGGDSGTLPREVSISKKLSWLLRHGAEAEGLELGPGGYANLASVLENRKIKSIKVSFEEVRQIVAENDKQRFSLIPISEAPKETPASDQDTTTTAPESSDTAAPVEDSLTFEPDLGNPSNWLIRANQGHSIKVEEAGLLEPLTLETPDLPTTVVHGTTGHAWPVILKSGGLKPMTRTHVHFASGLPAGFGRLDGKGQEEEMVKQPVISGMRNSSKILIYLDLEKVLGAGLKVWRSANGVILCSGNEASIIPVEFFKRVESRSKGGGVLLKDGQLVAES